MRKQKGFTLIELLVVIAIIGLLSTLAVVSLNSARQKARDAKRVADVKQIQTALELYSQDQNGYPAVAAPGQVLGAGTYACLGSGGFGAAGCANPYMGLIPAAPTPVDTGCTGAQNSYTYTSTASTSYSLTFCLGGTTGTLGAGTHTASQNGIQ
jgi:general secretion pathway protein G